VTSAWLVLLSYIRSRGLLQIAVESFFLDPLKVLITYTLIKGGSIPVIPIDLLAFAPLLCSIVAVSRALSGYELDVELKTTDHCRLTSTAAFLSSRLPIMLFHSLGSFALTVWLIISTSGSLQHLGYVLACSASWSLLGTALALSFGHRHEKSLNNFIFCLTWFLTAGLLVTQHRSDILHYQSFFWPTRIDVGSPLDFFEFVKHPFLCFGLGFVVLYSRKTRHFCVAKKWPGSSI
jgi:hypothetical protein